VEIYGKEAVELEAGPVDGLVEWKRRESASKDNLPHLEGGLLLPEVQQCLLVSPPAS
jgi:hypothetical protein